MGLSIFAPCVQADPQVALTTPLGEIRVQLHADKTETVGNFLAYISAGRFTNSFAQRLVPGFVLQGGGYTLQGATVTAVPTFPPIVNEYSVGQTRSNVFGTLAMARVGGIVNSATSQWFFNLGNNSSLDSVDGGFTVFGDVIAGAVCSRFLTPPLPPRAPAVAVFTMPVGFWVVILLRCHSSRAA